MPQKEIIIKRNFNVADSTHSIYKLKHTS